MVNPAQTDILEDVADGTRFVVVTIALPNIVLCRLDVTRLDLVSYPFRLVLSMLSAGKFTRKEATFPHFDIDALSDKQRAEYEERLSMMREIENAYGPEFLALCGNKSKPALKEIRERYGVKKSTFWDILLKYFQSGRMEYSLVDGRALSTHRDKPYKYTKKTGRPPKYGESDSVILDEETYAILDALVKDYLDNPSMSYQTLYDNMLATYYPREEIVNGKVQISYAPPGERPNLNQVRHYVETHTTTKQRHVAKTSEREYHNNERPLLGDEASDAHCPGDLVEIDAQEVDASLVALFDKDQCVSRATLYLMIDVYSKAIVAASIDFQKNSNQGFTNLLMCLGDDKHEFCQRYGMDFEGDLWPSNFIPSRVRVDRGAEMKSKMVEKILVKAGINRQLVPPASGSDKGSIETIFHSMGAVINVHLEKMGLITKRHDCKANEEAVLDIDSYSRLVLTYILSHNQMFMEGYRLTQDQKEAGVEAVPLQLWNYGVEKYGAPQPIVDKKQYLFNLMEEHTVKLGRRGGICYEGLYYMPIDDPKIMDDIRRLDGKKGEFKIKTDPRCVGAVCYKRDGRIVTAPLNPSYTKNTGVGRLTLNRWKQVRDNDAALAKIGRQNNQDIRAYQFAVMESILEDAKKDTYNNTKDIRAARAIEKERVAASSTIIERMDPELLAAPPAALPEHAEEPGPIDGPVDEPESIDGAAEEPAEGSEHADESADKPTKEPAEEPAKKPQKKSKYDMLKSVTDEVFGEMPKE